MKLRRQSLVSLMEDHKFLRVSLRGLRIDHPQSYLLLQEAYKKVQAYQMLEYMVNQESAMDTKYMFWCKGDGLPHVFEIKDNYSWTECQVFSWKTEIPKEAFQDIIKATA